MAAAVAFALLILAAGCGGDSSSSADATAEPAPSTKQAPSSPAPSSGSGKRSAGKPKEGDGRQGATGAPDDTSSSFEPKPHSDSGGGSKQFETKGGDNSIQEAGSEASSSEFDEAATVVHAYLDARAAGAWRDACGALAAPVVESLVQLSSQAEGSEGEAPPSDCPALIAALSAGIPPAVLRRTAEADVGAFRAQGDSGFVLFHGSEGDYFMPMAREDGRWKVAAIAASPLG